MLFFLGADSAATSLQYKIEKKVKEHHRKLRKLEKLKGTSKLKKDMGVPNLHPFKEQLLEKAAAAKVRREEQERRQKQSRRELMDTNRGLHDMVQDAQARGDAFKPESVETLAASAPAMELSRKQYYQEVKKVIDASDVVLQVLDARDPLTSRSLEMESRVLGSRKKLVLLLNKVMPAPSTCDQAGGVMAVAQRQMTEGRKGRQRNIGD